MKERRWRPKGSPRFTFPVCPGQVPASITPQLFRARRNHVILMFLCLPTGNVHVRRRAPNRRASNKR